MKSGVWLRKCSLILQKNVLREFFLNICIYSIYSEGLLKSHVCAVRGLVTRSKVKCP